MEHYDLVILGAGAAGLFCAGSVLSQGMRVLIVDHARAPGEKIRISGGGRCNFTNLATARDRFLSQNPRFCASALAGFTPRDFVALVDRAGIAWHEKAQGQLFCDGSARQIVEMLMTRAQGASLRLNTGIESVAAVTGGFRVTLSDGVVTAPRLVLATGGRSIPKMGATGLAYQIGAQFGMRLVEPRPGLVPLTFAAQELDRIRALSGVALPVSGRVGKQGFSDDLLFTHRGLSGPVILQLSSFWQPGNQVILDLCPGTDIAAQLKARKAQGGKVGVGSVLSGWLPTRLAEAILAEQGLTGSRLADQPHKMLDRLAGRVNRWTVRPVGSEGYRTAEVTVGGLDTRDLDARTMESRRQPGLYAIGEAVDVTGWLGGYNFQWAWASGHAAARAIRGQVA